jgi:hypothetical protein
MEKITPALAIGSSSARGDVPAPNVPPIASQRDPQPIAKQRALKPL